MEKLADKFKKNIIFLGLAIIFILFLFIMISECFMLFKNIWPDYTTLFDDMEYKNLLFIYGDTTIWFHEISDIKYFSLFAVIPFLGFIISIVGRIFTKEKNLTIMSIVWGLLFLLPFMSYFILTRTQNGFVLMPYYIKFITLQFLKFDNILSSLFYIFIFSLFVGVNIISLKRIYNK